MDDRVATLTNFDIPRVNDTQQEPEVSVFTLHQLAQVKTFLEEAKKEEEIFIDLPTDADKEMRTKYHQQIRQSFEKLESYTEKESNRIRVAWSKGQKNKKRKAKGKNDEKFRFVLWKENMDTSAAIDHLCRTIRCHSKSFNLAGTKDKRAITAQFVTTQLNPKRLISANKHLKNIKVGNFEFHTLESLSLGDLKGNEFNIVLRDCQVVGGDDEPSPKKSKPDFESIVKRACSELNKNGFINYYGLQRFGTSSIRTHEIGVEILKANFAGAIDLILKPREEPKRNGFLTEMRQIWEDTKDPGAALDKLSKKICNEGKILFGLKDNPGDFVGALGRLPRTMRQMYVHAVQSYIWNKLASYRISLGKDLMVGDLVQRDEKQKLAVELINEENINDFQLDHLVITSPGFDVEYSPLLKNKLGEILSELNLTKDSFSGTVKDYRLPGAYRKLIVTPDNAQTSLIMYCSINEKNLLKSERDHFPQLLGKSLFGDNNEEVENENDNKKDKVGIILKIKLPPSSYATMALREFLHCDQFE